MAQDTKALTVSRLEVENFKRLNEVKIDAGGRSLVLLRGPNAAGKSSILDSMISALGGKRHDPDTPIREGCESGSVGVTLSDAMAPRYQVRVEWTHREDDEPRRSLIVTDLGTTPPSKMGKPQTVLDGLVGELSFNPLAFANETNAKARAKMLLAAAGLESQYEQSTAKIAAAEDSRRVASGMLKRLEAVASTTSTPTPGEQLEPQDASALAEVVNTGLEHNRERATCVESIEAQEAAIAEQLQEIEALKASAAEHEALASGSKEWLAQHPAHDVDAAKAKLAGVSEHNAKCEQQARASANVKQIAEVRKAAKAADDLVKECRAKLQGLVAGADAFSSIKGLSVDEAGEVHLNGRSIDDASGCERLVLSATIGMLANPTVRIMCIDEADALDSKSLQALEELAEQHHYTSWLTAVWAASPTAQVVEVSEGSAHSESGD